MLSSQLLHSSGVACQTSSHQHDNCVGQEKRHKAFPEHVSHMYADFLLGQSLLHNTGS